MIPSSTYRLQLTAEFGFRDAAACVPYLAKLGISHLYLSPILESASGSMHGYDVVNHATLSTERGGAAGWGVLQSVLREYGLGCVVDVVPNHMAVPVPESDNPALWDVLRAGRSSAYARWFDIDWSAGSDRLTLPVLDGQATELLTAGELYRDGDVVRYADHVFPIAPGTEDLPLPELIQAQHYQLCDWRRADTRLNYRRFFDVTELIGLRVEDDEVFSQSHRLLLELVRTGDIQALRIDHPDGLSDPRRYLRMLRAAAPDAWIVVEKILQAGEELPADWPVAGSTGYDALRIVDGVLVDPGGTAHLLSAYHELTGQRATYHDTVRAAKLQTLCETLRPERVRLQALAVRCSPEQAIADTCEALDELLVAMAVYRTYAVPGEQPTRSAVRVIDSAVAEATARRRELASSLSTLAKLVLGQPPHTADRDEFMVRFQQVCGALMAKGVEDTAFYRWLPMASRCEVGGDPRRIALAVPEFHRWAGRAAERAMTTLSTHDTKRGEDVRARLAVLAELPREWVAAVRRWRIAAGYGGRVDGRVDGRTDYLLWQTLVGAWPLDAERLTGYLHKACREAKVATSWRAPDEDYERTVRGYAESVLANTALRSDVEAFIRRVHEPWVCNLLAAKLLQLTMPGVPDCYQGAEACHLRLVDPDNRMPVNYGRLGSLLHRVDTIEAPPRWWEDPDAAKAYLVSRTLRVRRERPDLFTGYQPLDAAGPAAEHLVAAARTGAVTAVTRLPIGLAKRGGWRDTTVQLPAGNWSDILTGRRHVGAVLVAELFSQWPVALLTR